MNIDFEYLEYYKKKFNENGYVLFENFFSQDEANNIIKYANEIEQWKEEKYKWMIYYENNESLSDNTKKKTRIENFINYHNEIHNLVKNQLQKLLEEITGKKMILFKDKLNWKYSNGKGFKAHQDHPAWTDFPPKKYITIGLFANHTTVENGCLQFVDGLHKKGILDYEKNNTGQISKELQEKMKWKYITTSPKDILIFDSFVPHKSDKNNTNESRRIFYFTFNYEEEGNFYDEYYKKKREVFPPDIERDNTKQYNSTGNKYNLANPIK